MRANFSRSLHRGEDALQINMKGIYCKTQYITAANGVRFVSPFDELSGCWLSNTDG